MTETDSTKRPLQMPEKFLPHLEKYRVYLMMKVFNIVLFMPSKILIYSSYMLGLNQF